MRKQFYLVCSAAIVVAATACSDSTGVNAGINQADANQLAADMDNVATLSPTDFGPGVSFSIGVDQIGSAGAAATTLAPFPINTTFTVTKQCPRGGQVVIDGSIVGTGDRTTHSLTVDANATRTDTNCAFDTKDGVLTINGNPNLQFTSHVNIVNGVPTGPQTQTHKGSFTWSRTGGSGTCDVDITSTYDPSTHTLTITGSFCGHQINVTKTRGS